MFFFYNNETPAEWVLGQIDCREDRKIFGVPIENQAVCLFKFRNGVKGYLETGYQSGIGGAANRIVGTDGFVEVHNAQPHVRVRGKGDGELRGVEASEGLHGEEAVARGVVDLIDALGTGREPELSGHRAIRTTEVIPATYESSRRRGRVDLPLDTDDNAFHAMLEAGLVGPKGAGSG